MTGSVIYLYLKTDLSLYQVSTDLIVLTSIAGKMLESLIKKYTVEFLLEHNIVSISLHGFTNMQSCQRNLLFFMKECAKTDCGNHILRLCFPHTANV